MTISCKETLQVFVILPTSNDVDIRLEFYEESKHFFLAESLLFPYSILKKVSFSVFYILHKNLVSFN